MPITQHATGLQVKQLNLHFSAKPRFERLTLLTLQHSKPTTMFVKRQFCATTQLLVIKSMRIISNTINAIVVNHDHQEEYL